MVRVRINLSGVIDILHISGEYAPLVKDVIADDDGFALLEFTYIALRGFNNVEDVELVLEECIVDPIRLSLLRAISEADVGSATACLQSLFVKPPSGRSNDDPDRWRYQTSFVTQVVISCVMSQLVFINMSAIVDALFDYGASLTEEVNGGTLLEWAVRFNCRDWVTYFLGKGAIPCTRWDRGTDALRLAAILGYEAVFNDILNHSSVPWSRRSEARRLWNAAKIIVRCEDYNPRFRLHESCSSAVSSNMSGIRRLYLWAIGQHPPTNNKGTLALILQKAALVHEAFGADVPALFAHRLMLASLMPPLQFSLAEIVDLFSCMMDAAGEPAFRFANHDISHLLCSCHNDLGLRQLADLLVVYSRRQLVSTEMTKLSSGFIGLMATLLELILQQTTSPVDAVAQLDGALHKATVLATALELWGSPVGAEPHNLEGFIRQLIRSGTYVGLARMLRDCETPLSAVRLRRHESVGKMIYGAACCQLSLANQELEDSPAHWRLPSLMCLAARRLNRCVEIEQLDQLPDVLINARGMLIPLAYLVDSHSAGYPRSVRIRHRHGRPSIVLGRVQLLDPELDYFGYF